MQADRFVTICFLYSGLILLTQYGIIYRFSVGIDGLAQLGVALSLFGVGLVRLRDPKAENQNPAEYELFAYGMAVISIILPSIFIVQLLIV